MSLPTSPAARFLLGAVIGGIFASVATQMLHSWDGQPVPRGRSKRKRRRLRRQDDLDGSEVDSAVPQATIARSDVVRGITGLIGNTPLMRIESLSELTGCEILGKAEFLNPAGSPKDRVALQILLDAEAAGLIEPHRGDCVFEGTVGSTGISLATLSRAKGYKCYIVLPDDVATEKSALLEKLGAQIKKVRPRGIVDPRHFVNEARRLAQSFGESARKEDGKENDSELVIISRQSNSGVASTSADQGNRRPRGFFADQFETTSNFSAHYRGTGPEIWGQCGGSPAILESDHVDATRDETDVRLPQLDAFVAGAGTGGTLCGVAAALREREAAVRQAQAVEAKSTHHRSKWWSSLRARWSGSNRSSPEPRAEAPVEPIRIVLADPFGSGLYNKVHHGVMYSATEAEGTRRRHQVDTIVEGVGMNRITRNLAMGLDLVDDAIRVQDEEAVRMGRWLSVRDGLFVGSSSCVNVIAAVKTAVKLKREWDARGKAGTPTVVTILCDSGVRHLSKFYSDETLKRDYAIELPSDPMQVDISDLFE